MAYGEPLSTLALIALYAAGSGIVIGGGTAIVQSNRKNKLEDPTKH